MNKRAKELAKTLKSKLEQFWQVLTNWPAGISVAYATTIALLFYRNNMFDTPPGQLFLPLTLFTLVVYLGYWIFSHILRHKQSTEIATLFFTIITIHFDRWFRDFRRIPRSLFETVPLSSRKTGLLLLTLGFGIALGIGFFLKNRENIAAAISKFLNAVIYSFLAITIGSLIYLWLANLAILTFKTPELTAEKSTEVTQQELPDIYYFIFDRYANNSTMQKYYYYNNQEFFKELLKSGFIVNENDYSNYGHTGPSVSSTLNMDYLDNATKQLPQMYSEMLYGEMINEASALKLLQQNGYEIGWSGSWWGPTRTNKSADVIYDEVFEAKIFGIDTTISEWQELLLSRHVLGRILAADLPIVSDLLHYDKPDRREIIHYQLDSIKNFVDYESESPKFGLWHFLTPHTPYVFDEDGNLPKYSANQDVKDRPEREKYVQQLKYTNKKIIETIDYILENSSKPPVIIFQPDEGPYIFKKEDVNQATISRPEQLRWRHGVTSAYYLPDRKGEEPITGPVNIFKYLFNNYMGYKLEYLPDRQYHYTKAEPYSFEDITDLIESGD